MPHLYIGWDQQEQHWYLQLELGEDDIDLTIGSPEYLKAVAEIFVAARNERDKGWYRNKGAVSATAPWYYRGFKSAYIRWDDGIQRWVLMIVNDGRRSEVTTSKTVEPLKLAVAVLRAITAM